MTAALELVDGAARRGRAPGRLRRRIPRLSLSRAEAAEALGVSVTHFDRHIRDDLPVVYSGELKLYPVSALQAWLEDQAIKPGRRSS